MAIQESSENPRVSIRKKRTKGAFIQLRVTEGDREMIRSMAEKAEMTMTDFVLSRVWGEEIPVVSKVEATRLPIPVEVQALKEISKPLVPPRPYDGTKRGRYEIEGVGLDWAGLAFDRDTHEWFLVIRGKGVKYENREACLRALDAMQG